MRIYILALDEVFDTGLSTVLDTFSIANDLAESAGTPSVHFEVTVVGVRRRVHTSQGLSVWWHFGKCRLHRNLCPCIGYNACLHLSQ